MDRMIISRNGLPTGPARQAAGPFARVSRGRLGRGLSLTLSLGLAYRLWAAALSLLMIGRAAFQQGDVDAWAIWDPYYSAALSQGNVRVLTDGRDLNLTGSFYLAPRSFTQSYGPFVSDVLARFSQADKLTRSDRDASIDLLAATLGLPRAVVALFLDHRPPMTITPVSAQTAARRQQTADLFYAHHLIPVKVTIARRIWSGAPPAHH